MSATTEIGTRAIGGIQRLWLHNFRCFQRLVAPLRPLTFLVGENSTGKTSFLAAARLAWDMAYSSRRLDFNEDPFPLGSFEQLTHYRGGRAGRAATFSMSMEVSRGDESGRVRGVRGVVFGAEFKRSGSHPVFARQFARTPRGTAEIQFATKESSVRLRLGDKELDYSIDDMRVRVGAEAPLDWSYLPSLVATASSSLAKRHAAIRDMEVIELFRSLVRAGFPRPTAFGPVRTRPLRVYNPISDAPVPEGEHVPMVLARMFFEDNDGWLRLRDALNAFGSASGLFSAIDIKPLGKYESDPFQIQVKFSGPKSNVVDVGYGVSQVLPILVDTILGVTGSTYLLQQPEVHLHPRAQAELGTFLASLVHSRGIRAIVETHSDYMIDRVRADVRAGSIPSDAVLLLFFERRRLDVRVHPIRIDDSGNLQGAPQGFRSFFLRESRRLLGV